MIAAGKKNRLRMKNPQEAVPLPTGDSGQNAIATQMMSPMMPSPQPMFPPCSRARVYRRRALGHSRKFLPRVRVESRTDTGTPRMDADPI